MGTLGVKCHIHCTFTELASETVAEQLAGKVPSNTSLCPVHWSPKWHWSQTSLSCWCCGSPFQTWAVEATSFNASQLSLSVWMASLKQFFKSVSFCHMHTLQRSKCCKVKPSLEKPFLSYSWINFQFQTTWFYSCPSNTLIIAFSAFFHLMEKVGTLPMMA